MGPGPSNLELPPTVFTILRDLIHDRVGMYFDDGKRELLAEKLSSHVLERGFRSFLDFYYLLKYGPEAEREWPLMIDVLSVQETYFWREMTQVTALVNDIAPRYAATHPQRPLRIWCAACATGEEPLSIAMAFAEAGSLSRMDIEIQATDASQAAIAKARRGIYRERSFRSLPNALRQKYFSQTPNGWQIRPEIHSQIHWSVANLLNPSEVAAFVNVPFIFCRNVFIYFTDETITRAVDSFARGMKRPGYLFVGVSESLLRITDEFELQEAGDAFVYTLA